MKLIADRLLPDNFPVPYVRYRFTMPLRHSIENCKLNDHTAGSYDRATAQENCLCEADLNKPECGKYFKQVCDEEEKCNVIDPSHTHYATDFPSLLDHVRRRTKIIHDLSTTKRQIHVQKLFDLGVKLRCADEDAIRDHRATLMNALRTHIIQWAWRS